MVLMLPFFKWSDLSKKEETDKTEDDILVKFNLLKRHTIYVTLMSNNWVMNTVLSGV